MGCLSLLFVERFDIFKKVEITQVRSHPRKIPTQKKKKKKRLQIHVLWYCSFTFSFAEETVQSMFMIIAG